MIFVLSKEQPVLFVMLSEKDITEKLRPGYTLYVDPSMINGQSFNHIIISLGKSDEENRKMVAQANPNTAGLTLVEKQQGEGELTCEDCKGVMDRGAIFRGKCTVCWYKRATVSEDETK